jgi:hypothetical protein
MLKGTMEILGMGLPDVMEHITGWICIQDLMAETLFLPSGMEKLLQQILVTEEGLGI